MRFPFALLLSLTLASAGVLAGRCDALAQEPAVEPVQRAAADAHDPTEVPGQEWTSAPVGGLNKEVEVELYGSTRTASPGGLVIIRYSINSYEDQDERVRLRLRLPPGWVLLDRDIEGREMLLESWEMIEGEIRVEVPRDARPGERQRVQVYGEVVGEPGAAAVFSYVQVVRRGGLKAGEVGLTGTTSLIATNFAVQSLEGARYGGVVDLSGKLTRQTTLSLNYREGPRESNLTNYRIAQEETRLSGMLRNAAWTLQFGNQLQSAGTVLTGPYVRGRGASVRRTQGLFVGDLIVAEPTSLVAEPAGRLVRGSLGVSGSAGRASIALSDFQRPTGYSTAPRYPEDVDPDSLERLERERKALEAAARNHVRGAGLDLELRTGKLHRFNVRGGWLRLSNAMGDTVSDASTEAQYSLMHSRATFTARWREMPLSLQGIMLPGNETSVDGSLKLIGEVRAFGRAYRTSSHTLRNAYVSDGEGASGGLRFYRNGWRGEVRANYREWSYGDAPTIARTGTLSFGVPVGPLTFNGSADIGEQEKGPARQTTSSYRGDLRWSGKAGTASWSGSYYETLASPPRLRTDVLGSLKLGEWELAGGGWLTRGWKVGGEPGIWTQVGAPISYDLLLTFGIEHAPPAYGQPPQWLGTLGVRKKVAFAIPFLRDRSVSPPLQSASPAEGQAR